MSSVQYMPSLQMTSSSWHELGRQILVLHLSALGAQALFVGNSHLATLGDTEVSGTQLSSVHWLLSLHVTVLPIQPTDGSVHSNGLHTSEFPVHCGQQHCDAQQHQPLQLEHNLSLDGHALAVARGTSKLRS